MLSFFWKTDTKTQNKNFGKTDTERIRFSISGVRFRVFDFEFSISSFRFRVFDFEFSISSFRLRVFDFEFLISSFWFRVFDFEFSTSSVRFRVFEKKNTKKNIFGETDTKTYTLYAVFFKTLVMVPVARKSYEHKISAPSLARVMKPFTNVYTRSKLWSRMFVEKPTDRFDR